MNKSKKLTPAQILSRVTALVTGRVGAKYLAAEALADKNKKARGGKVKPKKMMGGKVAKKRMYGGSVKKRK